MSGRIHAIVAVTLAAALHLGAFALRPDPAGAVSAGAGGEDVVSIQAAEGALADLVAEWTRPPEALTEAPAAEPQPMTEALPDLPQIDPAVSPLPRLPDRVAPLMPQAPDLSVAAEIFLPPPVAEPEPEPVRKPEPKPARKSEPAARPKPQAPAVPAQKAAGSGGGAAAGDAGDARAATLAKAWVNDLKASWGASIRARVERRKIFPKSAAGISGTVIVRLTVTHTGTLGGVSVAKSSGNAALDAAAVKAVTAAGKFPPAPRGLDDQSYTFTLPMKFAK